jgi:type I restriction enzyme S subunit
MLPRGWRLATLNEVAETALGKMLDRGKQRGHEQVRYLRNVNVQWGHIDTSDLLTMELASHDRDRFEVLPGDLLVCEGGEIGRSAIWRGDGRFIAYQKALHRIRSRGDLDVTYLRYLLEHHSFSGVLEAHATGSTIAHLPQQNLRRLPVLLPLLDEQRRIVEILEDHLSRLDAADNQLRRVADRVRVHLARTIDSVLFAPHSSWPQGRVADLLREGMRNGHSASATGSTSGIRALTLTAVTKNDFSDRHTKLTSADPEKIRNLWLQSGDILVQRANTPDLVGTTAMYRGRNDWAIFPDLLIRLRTQEDRVSPDFLVAVLRSERVHRRLRARAKGLAGSMPKIDQAAIGELLVPVPDVTTQRAAVSRIAEAQATVDRLILASEHGRHRADLLRRSLLAAAFSGRLTGVRDVSEVVEELAGV